MVSGLPVPILMIQAMLLCGNIIPASFNTTSVGLLRPRPPSTYGSSRASGPMKTRLKNVGAAEVARAACHIVQGIE
ncbi:hypothetical protein H0H87_011452, partial [Tephrocybe sp. NHM501043]